MHTGQIYVLLNQKRGQKTAKKRSKNGQKWANVNFEWGFLIKPHDFYDFYVWFLSQLNGPLQDLEAWRLLSPVDLMIKP